MSKHDNHSTATTGDAVEILTAKNTTGIQYYSWHLSLRVDRPVEGCSMRPHAYMYSKKLDERDLDKPLPSHSKKMREPPPHHEFVYRWFRGPAEESCAYDGCPRRTSFSPHDWSLHALGMRHGVGPSTVKQPAACRLQCVSTQSSLFQCTFCNSKCFVQAWKTQYTIPKNPATAGQYQGGYVPAGSRSATPTPYTPHRSPSFDDTASVGSTGSGNNMLNQRRSPIPPTTPKRGYSQGTNYNSYSGGNANNSNDHGEEEWVEVSRDQIFIPGPDDVGRKLKLEAAAYSHDSGERLMFRVVKTDLVLARAPDPLTRQLVVNTGMKGTGATTTTTTHTSAANLPHYGNAGARFRVVTYNVLAEIYATQQQYPYCDFWALSWDYRFQNILREIMDASPEVVCLQEVQADHYESHLYAAMSEAGYEGVFKQKTRQSMGLAGKVDGCALFWKRSTFHLVESYSIEFNELAQRQATQLGLNTTPQTHRGSSNDEGVAFMNRLSKDNVAQLVVLELAQPPSSSSSSKSGAPQSQICIANTHLYSNKDFPDVKLWQSWQLLQELETFVMSRGGSPNSLPLIICGDFNSTPDTAVYELLSRQTVHPGHPDVNVNYTQQQSNGEDIPNILPDAHNITHSFQLGSAYQSVLGEEPKQTNYTGHFKGVLDYVWYSIPSLRPLSAAPIPSEAMLTRHGEALPSTEFSSDHIMLISDFQMLSGNGGGNGLPGGRS